MSTASDTSRVQCTGCKAGFKLKSTHLGKNVKCPKCKTTFTAVAMKARGSQTTKPGPPSVSPATRPVQKLSTPAGTKRCDMCHEFIPIAEFEEHLSSHAGTQEDGQLNEYPTLPPEERYQGDLSDVPMWYKHDLCGSVTGMPEEIVRTYLVNPYFYGYKTYCSGCQTHVPQKDIAWTTTGQNVMEYTRELQAKNPNSKKYRAGVFKQLIGVSLIGGILLGLLLGAILFFVASLPIAAITAAVATLLGTVAAYFALLGMRGGI